MRNFAPTRMTQNAEKATNAASLATARGRRMADATPLYNQAPTTPTAIAASADRQIHISPLLIASMVSSTLITAPHYFTKTFAAEGV